MRGRIEIDDVTGNVEETVGLLVELRDDFRDAERELAEGRRELVASKLEFAAWKRYARRRVRGFRRARDLLSASGTETDVASLVLALDGRPDAPVDSESADAESADSGVPSRRSGTADSATE